jgi:hypothetical protein
MDIKNIFKRDGNKEIKKKFLSDIVEKVDNKKSGETLLPDPKKFDRTQEVPLDTETVRIMTREGNTNRLSKISKDERDELLELIMFDKMVLSEEKLDDEELAEFAAGTILDLNCSVDGFNIESLIRMRQTYIVDQIKQ